MASIQENPCNLVDAPAKADYHANVYTPEQVRTLIEASASCRWFIGIMLAVTCGRSD